MIAKRSLKYFKIGVSRIFELNWNPPLPPLPEILVCLELSLLMSQESSQVVKNDESLGNLHLYRWD